MATKKVKFFKEVAAVVSFNPSLWFGKPDPAAFDA